MHPEDPPSLPGSPPGSQSDDEATLQQPYELSTASPTGIVGAADRVGPYRILEKIGEGGMGMVFLAEQERPIRRRVALKLVKLGMDTKEVVARFEAERQALAMMDHPNIARVFDAGATEHGRPYFVMEHVAGVRITDYCDSHQLSTRERLKLFAQVCDAIQHAHQKAIIHRDLKPSNVLVTILGEAPVPKVIDFGVAKATGHRLTERTMFTELGQVIGTPEYMSPEQADVTGLNVDTRADIYSLGVILYELLVGALPFDSASLRKGGLDGILKLIREKEPPRPSSRVSQLGEQATPTAERRKTTAPALCRQLRYELDWITMKALEKDRTRRYQTASEFAADIGRYLHDEPVLAGPPSKAYWLRKYVKRNKGPVAATVAVLVAVVTFGSISLWQGRKAQAEGFRAQANAILASAASAKDPLVKALLVRELDGLPALTTGELSKAQGVLGAPLPVAVIGGQGPGANAGAAVVAALSPDGSRVVIGYGDGDVRVWRADGTGAPAVLKGHEGSLNFVAFSPDGKSIVTCGWDRTARVWPVEGGAPVVLRGHEDQVYRAVFSPEGRRVVTASADGTARIWRADGAGDPTILRGHTDEVRSASFSGDGTRVVTASIDRTARVWQADGNGAPVVLSGHEGTVNSATFSPDGQRLLTVADDRSIRVWRPDGRGAPVVLKGHDGRVNSAAFSPDGQSIVTASDDRTARVWRSDGSGQPAVLDGHTEGLWLAQFSPDGSRILTASEDGTARVWERSVAPTAVPTLRQLVPAGPYRGRKIRFRAKVRAEVDSAHGFAVMFMRAERDLGALDKGQASEISGNQWREYEIVGTVAEDAVSIFVGIRLIGSRRVWMDAATLEVVDGPAPGGAGLIDGGFESERLRWNLYGPGYAAQTVEENPAEGRRCLLFQRHAEPRYLSTLLARHGRGIRVAELDSTGKSVLTMSTDGTARMWKTDVVGEPVVLRGHEGEVYSAVFSPDGRRIVTALQDGTARVWRTDGNATPVVLRGHEGRVESAAFSPDGQRIVTASDDGTARVWPADGSGTPIVLRGHEDELASAAFSPDGRRIVTASADHTARVWQADGTEKPFILRGHEDGVNSAAFSPDGQHIVTGSADRTARVWRADGTGEPVVFRGHEYVVMGAAFSPDGQRIVTASADHTARVWRADGTGEPFVLRAHQDVVQGAVFSPDGQRIVTASWDGTARVWRADGTGEPIVLKGHELPVNRASFSPDGQRVATASDDGTARVWRVTWEGLFDYLRANVALCLSAEDRTLYLGESRSDASERYAGCEKERGRTPSIPEATP